MITSKGWDWSFFSEISGSGWGSPALESYGLAARWAATDKQDFLDLGCGLGRHSILFGKLGFHVSCFDISPEAVKRTKEQAEKEGLAFSCQVGDMLSLPYESDSFDCILCWNVLNHTDTDGIRSAISEISRVLRPGGECYLTLGSKSTWGWQQDWPMVDENTKLRMEEGPEYMVPHFYADKELIEELFRQFEMIGITHVEDWGNNNRGTHYHVHIRKPEGSR